MFLLSSTILNIIAFALNLTQYNITYLPLSNGEIIMHKYYTLAYNEETEQANWVFYKITKEMLLGNAKRNDNFRSDPMVSTGSASTNDYTNTGYDRGHLCPAADMKFSDIAIYESFYLSNVSPQIPEFNRGIWKQLENKVRDWTREKDSLYVVSGPIFTKNGISIGQNKVKVPSYFFKVLFAPYQKQMIAFILPNDLSRLSFENYASTSDLLEQITGFDFFSQLPDTIENRLESEIRLEDWFDIKIIDNEPSSKNKKTRLFIIIFTSCIIFVISYKFIKR